MPLELGAGAAVGFVGFARTSQTRVSDEWGTSLGGSPDRSWDSDGKLEFQGGISALVARQHWKLGVFYLNKKCKLRGRARFALHTAWVVLIKPSAAFFRGGKAEETSLKSSLHLIKASLPLRCSPTMMVMVQLEC